MNLDTGIYLLTGNPGSGKSLYAVWLIHQVAKVGNRPIFTNITGITIPGVSPLPGDADWRSLPDGSLVVFDECQDIEDETGHRPYAATGQAGLVRDGRLAELRQHRKRQFSLVFITQHPTFVHHEVRKITDYHHHFLRVMGLQRSTKFTFTGSYCLNPEKSEERRRGDKEFWRYPKHLFGLYHSAQGHNIGFKMPRKVAMVGIAVILTSALGVWFLLGRVGLGDESVLVQEARAEAGLVASSPNTARGEPPSDQFTWTDSRTVTPIAGCAVLTHSCRCWNTAGLQLALSEGECLAVALQPLPLSFVASNSGGVGGVPPTAAPSATPPESGEGGGLVGVSGARSQVGPPGDRMGQVW